VECCYTRAPVRHAASVVYPVDFDRGEQVYQSSSHKCAIVDISVIMPAKEAHGCHSGSVCLDRHEPRDILHYHVERRDQSVAVAKRAER